MKSRVCELCSGEANLYCDSDSAFLCWDCDARVHRANFLVARHVRQTVCCRCNAFDGNQVSGAGSRPIRPVCRSCSPDGADSCSSLSLECISTAESFTDARNRPRIRRSVAERSRTRRTARSCSVTVEESSSGNVDARAEGILVIWSRAVGLKNGCCLAVALHAFGICLRKFTVLPFRVCLASSLWFAAKLCETRGLSTRQLKKLGACSGVPPKSILFVEAKLSRVLKLPRSSRQEEEEGWAECSDG